MTVLTRWTAALIVFFLVDAAQLLLLVPDRTAELWAWEILPEITAMVLASAYVAGGYFFVRVAFGAPWRAVAPGFPGVIVFVWFAAAATFLHLDRFIEQNLAFYAWIALYVVTPIAIPLLYLANEREAPPREGPYLPRALRIVLATVGAIVVAAGAVMLVSPSTAIDAWPWTLTPLTARIMAAVVALYGTVWVAVAADGTRLGARIPLQSHALGLATFLVVMLVEGELAPLLAAVAAAMLLTSTVVGIQRIGPR